MNSAIVAPLATASLALVSLSLSYREAKPAALIVEKATGYTLLALATWFLYAYQLIDVVSALLGIFFAALAIPISVYTHKYVELAKYEKSLGVLIDAFMFVLISTYIAPTLLLLIVFWTTAEVLGYAVIRKGEEHSIEGPLTSARGFILVSTLTYELTVFTLIALSILVASALAGIGLLNQAFHQVVTPVNLPLLFLPLVLLGFLTKAAIVPLHFWLPSAHSNAPSPGSSILSGIMSLLGFYGLYRILNMLSIGEYRSIVVYALVVLGAATVLYGGSQALMQRDVKKMLAYSTIATNGYILLVFAIYVYTQSTLAFWAFILSVVMHASYKTTLFCEAGLVESVFGTRYIHNLRGLVKFLPLSTSGGLLAVLSLLGAPGTIGFSSKVISIVATIELLNINTLLAIAILISIVAYIAFSALVALNYVRIYTGHSKLTEVLEAKKPSMHSQAPVLALGTTNVASNLVVFTSPEPVLSLVLGSMSTIAVLLAYTAYMYFKRVSER